jgi:hypothetical protein
MLVYVASRSADGDGGEGYWRFDSGSSATANGGTILAPDAGSGRWLRQYSGAVNVLWFGAKGDGTTDDTAAIQAAVNGVPDGTVIHFPSNTYRATAQIAVNTKNITFKGEDRTYSVLKFDDGSYTGIKTSTTGAQNGQGFAIVDLFVRGTTSSSPAIQLCDFTNNSPYVVIQRSTFGFADVCVRLGETYVVKILDNQFNNCNTAILAVADGSQADCIIRGNTFGTCPDNTDVLLDLEFAGMIVDGNYFETETRKKPCCIFRTGSQRATLSNNLFQVENGLACQVETSVTAVILGNVIEQSYDETNERVIRIDGGADAVITGNRIWPDGSTSGNGISASGAIVATGNNIRGCGGTAIAIGEGTAIGNRITNSGVGISASGQSAVGFNEFVNNTTDLSLGGSSATIAALNYATTITESNSSAAVFANTPRRVALYERYGQTTYDPPNLNDGDGDTTTVTVTGAALGDYVPNVSFSLDLQGITVTAWVSAADTVSVRFQNETGGTLNLGSGTLRVITRKGS